MSSSRRVKHKALNQRVCASHGWITTARSIDGLYHCPQCGKDTLTRRQYEALRFTRNAARLNGREV